MVADGIFNISTVVELLNTDSMNIDYEHLTFLVGLLLCVGDR